jgi:hypothetical protein
MMPGGNQLGSNIFELGMLLVLDFWLLPRSAKDESPHKWVAGVKIISSRSV